VVPPEKRIAREACTIALRRFGYRGGGSLAISSNLQVGSGQGSSTADAVASILAAYHAFQKVPSVEEQLGILKQCDTGVDSTAISSSVCIVASRRFKVVENLHRPMPHLLGVAFDTQPGVRVDTASLYNCPPSDPLIIEKGNFLRNTFRQALLENNLPLLGKVMSASARLGEDYLKNPLIERIFEVSRETGGLGVFRAHTGTICGIVFDPRDPAIQERIEAAQRQLSALGAGQPFVFSTRCDKEMPNEEELPIAA